MTPGAAAPRTDRHVGDIVVDAGLVEEGHRPRAADEHADAAGEEGDTARLGQLVPARSDAVPVAQVPEEAVRSLGLRPPEGPTPARLVEVGGAEGVVEGQPVEPARQQEAVVVDAAVAVVVTGEEPAGVQEVVHRPVVGRLRGPGAAEGGAVVEDEAVAPPDRHAAGHAVDAEGGDGRVPVVAVQVEGEPRRVQVGVEGLELAAGGEARHRLVLEEDHVRRLVGQQQLLDLLGVAGGDVLAAHGDVGVGADEGVDDLLPHLVLAVGAPVGEAQLPVLVGEVVGPGVAEEPQDRAEGEPRDGQTVESPSGSLGAPAQQGPGGGRRYAHDPGSQVHAGKRRGPPPNVNASRRGARARRGCPAAGRAAPRRGRPARLGPRGRRGPASAPGPRRAPGWGWPWP